MTKKTYIILGIIAAIIAAFFLAPYKDYKNNQAIQIPPKGPSNGFVWIPTYVKPSNFLNYVRYWWKMKITGEGTLLNNSSLEAQS